MSALDLPLRAAVETVRAHGLTPDRCEILQDGHTLVVRLTETLVARVVQGRDGPRQGTAWFARETALARHLTCAGAPVIPLHPDLPPGPHEHLGFPINFWEFVTRVGTEPEPAEIGRTLRQCHEALRSFPEPLPALAILTESLAILDARARFPEAEQRLLRRHLEAAVQVLGEYPAQPLHGDAHAGNGMNTTRGLLWTDWEDTFAGPVEWDLASVLWNAWILDGDLAAVAAIRAAYGPVDERALRASLTGRAAVMSAWYPILYPHADAARQTKLRRRLDWLAAQPL